MGNFQDPFESNHFYHVYNHANGNENLFIEHRSYDFFLKWDKYLGGYMDVWAYCLLPNHFHFVVEIKNEVKMVRHSKFSKPEMSCNQFISNQFKNFFISYAKSFNRAYDRRGNLFQKPSK